MARVKKDNQEKSGRGKASTKLSKEMKADIEKMIDKRLSSIEKQLEKLKSSDSKSSNSKGGGRKASGKAKAKKTGGRGRKKSNQRNEDAE